MKFKSIFENDIVYRDIVPIGDSLTVPNQTEPLSTMIQRFIRTGVAPDVIRDGIYQGTDPSLDDFDPLNSINLDQKDILLAEVEEFRVPEKGTRREKSQKSASDEPAAEKRSDDKAGEKAADGV